jgi:formamidopyrimidine-DNA glycosylase
MPELPEVEGFRRRFARAAQGRVISDVITTDRTIVRNASPATLDRALRGHRFERPERLGKWLIARTDGPTVLLHFGMTGDIVAAPQAEGRHPHDRVIFVLSDGEVRYRNMRKFGGVWLAHDRVEEQSLIGLLGPDAAAVDRDSFVRLLARKRGSVKAALMDQTFIAGVGNLVADEVLWQARLHPERRIETLSPRARDALYDVMQDVLRRSVRRGGLPDAPGWFLAVRGEPDARCPRCGTLLARSAAGGRTGYFCPRCQRRSSARSR